MLELPEGLNIAKQLKKEVSGRGIKEIEYLQSPLGKNFNEKYFMDIMSSVEDKISAKALLATEQRIPGLGNGVLQDILFNARINPQSKLKNLTAAEIKDMYKSMKSTLKDMASKKGRNTEKDIYGAPGEYDTILSSKKAGLPCPVCGGPITKKAYMGGNIYYCEQCQPIKK